MDFLKHLRKREGAARAEPAPFELAATEAGELATAFAAPRWLRDLGRTSWLLVGFFVLVAGLVWLLGATYTIVGPVVAGTIVATVSMPIVGYCSAMPRAAAAGLVLRAGRGRRFRVRDRDRRDHFPERCDLGNASAGADKAGMAGGSRVDNSGSSSVKSEVSRCPEDHLDAHERSDQRHRGAHLLAFALSFTLLTPFFS